MTAPATSLRPSVIGGRGGLRSPVLAAGLVAALSVALHFRDPHDKGSWGYCPTKYVTGFDCPGCGGLRAVNDLTDGHLLQAASSNLLFVASIPLIVGAWIWWLSRAWLGLPTRPDDRVVKQITRIYVVLALAFAVIRNTPWGHWLHS